MSRITATYVIAEHFGWDIRKLKNYRFEYGKTNRPIFAIGNRCLCAVRSNQKPAKHESLKLDWRIVESDFADKLNWQIWVSEIRTNILQVSYEKPNASELLSEALKEIIIHYSEIVIVCIGTDRSTGDSLGPLVGMHLFEYYMPNYVTIYGDLDEPIHAVNLENTMGKVYENHNSPFVIAVDACLGQLSSIGMIHLIDGGLKPGLGVGKEHLPVVGDIGITGIVNVGGFREQEVLQNTRLSVVMRMAKCIAEAIMLATR